MKYIGIQNIYDFGFQNILNELHHFTVSLPVHWGRACSSGSRLGWTRRPSLLAEERDAWNRDAGSSPSLRENVSLVTVFEICMQLLFCIKNVYTTLSKLERSFFYECLNTLLLKLCSKAKNKLKYNQQWNETPKV